MGKKKDQNAAEIIRKQTERVGRGKESKPRGQTDRMTERGRKPGRREKRG